VTCRYSMPVLPSQISAEYGLTFPALLSWLYDVEDEEEDIHQRLLHAHNQEDGDEQEEEEDEDVRAERVRVMGGAADQEVVRIQQLRKIYPANSRQGGLDPLTLLRSVCRKTWAAAARLLGAEPSEAAQHRRSRQAAVGAQQRRYKVAVQSLCFGIPKGQCFGFLGKCPRQCPVLQI
jgi:hypothetical protein